ncbi:Uncharacterised protein [uncultured archaeon]|nr:Uncharacterised protein [uncultured archaeon]
MRYAALEDIFILKLIANRLEMLRTAKLLPLQGLDSINQRYVSIHGCAKGILPHYGILQVAQSKNPLALWYL